ncbi:MAG: cytochrome c [Pseudomonadota bacterium]
MDGRDGAGRSYSCGNGAGAYGSDGSRSHERMKGMTALKDTVAELAPMMQGVVLYDTYIVSEGTSVIASHAGETVLSLFPKNSLEGVTYAKPENWSNWQSFAALADELKTCAEALAEAAPNGLEPVAPSSDDMAGMSPSDMVMPEPSTQSEGFTVAELMGYVERPDAVAVARGTFNPAELAVDLTALSVDDLFTRISATCSFCHAQFHAGRN